MEAFAEAFWPMEKKSIGSRLGEFSLRPKLLNREVSKVVSPGLANETRGTFPKIPTIGSTKALGLNYRSGLPRITGPLKSGFRLSTSGFVAVPVPEIFEPASDVNGKPLCAVKMPCHCQPPIR